MYIVFVLLVFVVSCSHQPTTVVEADQSFFDRSFQFERAHRPVKIQKDTVVVDVRAFFDYQVATLPEAIHLNADEFYLKNVSDRNFEQKASELARRLALLGVTPFSHVVVMGYGEKGRGEEGIIGLSLLALGVERVQIVSVEHFKSLLSSKKKQQKENQRYWEPRIVRSLFCSAHPRRDTMFVLNVDGKMTSGQNFLQKLASVNMSWMDFVNKDDFSPNYKIKSELSHQEIKDDSLVMVRGQHGPLVVFNMIQLGYQHVCWKAE